MQVDAPIDKQFTDKHYIRLGVMMLLVLLTSSTYWFFNSELNSAAIAPGIVSVEGQRKAVEHLEGGIVESVLVNEGELVSENQPLIKLSSVAAKTHFTQLNLKYFSLLAESERLISERNQHKTVNYSQELLAASSIYPTLAEVLDTQTYLFQARNKLRTSKLASIDTKVKSIITEQQVLREKIAQESLALSFLEKELNMNNTLLKGGYSSQLRVYELQRTQAQFNANLIELNGRLQNSLLALKQTEEEKAALEYQYTSEIGQALQSTNKSKSDIVEQLQQAQDVLSRVVIKSPTSGRVVGLKVFNRGDVISPGETLLEVVPSDERMIILASIKPEDIDVVQTGQNVLVRLSAYNFRTTPPLKGKVIHVAADRLLDTNERFNVSGFKIKVSIDSEELARVNKVTLHPGMPAEVYIQLNVRTPVDYLLEPLSLDIFRAFRE